MMQEWFKEAKLGIFIHWGIYAVNSVGESWSFYSGDISYDDYMAQLSGFTAKNYDPVKWAELFKKAGAKYAVLTTKHHDGVALWDTKESDLSVVNKSTAARDLVGPYCEALREHGLKVGLYFSHLDWSHPSYASLKCNSDEWWAKNKYSAPEGDEDYEKWDDFIKFHRAQLKELSCNFGKIDLFWFDGVWERTEEQFDMKELRNFLHSFNSEVVLNSRMGEYGDYATPEQGVPINAPNPPWELCMTINDSWGYQVNDNNYKTTRQIVRIFTECLSMGGNLLLDIGPKEDGTIDERQEKVLLELGQWIRKHEEAVYSTEKGLPHGHFTGGSSLNKAKDVLYLYLYDIPIDQIMVKGIKNNIKSISVVGLDRKLTYQKIGGFIEAPGVLWIDVPKDVIDANATVIKIELDKALDLYVGKGEAIK